MSLLYTVDLRGVWDVYPETNAPPHDENLGVLSWWGVLAAPVFFARGAKGEDDKVYLINPESILCYNLADRTCRKIFALNSCIAVNLSWSHTMVEGFPFALSLFSP